MTSYRRRDFDGRPDRAAESGGAYDPSDPGPAGRSPLERLAERVDEYETARRRLLDSVRDAVAWGGTGQTTGYTFEEWLQLCGRLAGRESWKFTLLSRRLPALPATASLLERGQISFDQAVSIVTGTTKLSGADLEKVDRVASAAAVDRNRRGDHPDVEPDVELLVRECREPSDQDRLERAALDQSLLTIKPDIFGGGDIYEHQPDAQAFQTRVAALEHAAGPPDPDTNRKHQLAEGAVAMSRAWLAGRAAHPLVANPTGGEDTAAGDHALLDRFDHPPLPTSPDEIDLGPSSARPTIVLRIDVRDLDGIDPHDPDDLRFLATASTNGFGRVMNAGRLSSTPWLARQAVDTLACNADLLVTIVDGVRPLAEFRRTRGIPRPVRRQVLFRDLGCRWPGCTAPVAHCDRAASALPARRPPVHHLDEDPANHDVDNLLSLCRRHHRRLHSHFWHWRLDGRTGRFDLLRRPDGPPVHTTYPGGTRPPPEVPEH